MKPISIVIRKGHTILRAANGTIRVDITRTYIIKNSKYITVLKTLQ